MATDTPPAGSGGFISPPPPASEPGPEPADRMAAAHAELAKSMKRFHRPTAVEIEQRRNKVFELLCHGVSRTMIQKYAEEKTDWNVSKKTLDAYMAHARTKYLEEARWDREELLGEMMCKQRQIYSKCMQINDYKTAIAALREIQNLGKLTEILVQVRNTGEQQVDLRLQIVHVTPGQDGELEEIPDPAAPEETNPEEPAP